MSPEQVSSTEPVEQPDGEPEAAASVSSSPAADSAALQADRELRRRTIREVTEWVGDYEVELLAWTVEEGRITLDEAVELAGSLVRRGIADELRDAGTVSPEEERAQAVAFYEQADNGASRETLIRLLVPRVRNQLALFVLSGMIATGRITLSEVLELADEANARLDKPGVPKTLELMVERGRLTTAEIDEFQVGMQRVTERNASRSRNSSPEQVLLAGLRRMTLHGTGVSPWPATMLDYLVEIKRITLADAMLLAEAAADPYAILEHDLIDTGLIHGDEVEGLRHSTRYEDIRGAFAEADGKPGPEPIGGFEFTAEMTRRLHDRLADQLGTAAEREKAGE